MGDGSCGGCHFNSVAVYPMDAFDYDVSLCEGEGCRQQPKVLFCFRLTIDSAARSVYIQRALRRRGRALKPANPPMGITRVHSELECFSCSVSGG